MDSRGFDTQEALKYIENLQLGLTTLKKLIFPQEEMQRSKKKTRIQELREQLMDEGFDEELVQLVGTVPKRKTNYKDEIRSVIYKKYQRFPGESIEYLYARRVFGKRKQ